VEKMRKKRPTPSRPSRSLEQEIARNEAKAVSKYLSKERTGEALILLGEDALRFADRTNARAHKLRTIPPVACKAGCAWCCSTQVIVSAPEVVYLAEYLRDTRSKEELDALREQLAAQWSRVKNIPVLERLLVGVPCALLRQSDNCCSVYDARPLACRGHTSLDAGKCEAATRSKGVTVTSDAIQSKVYHGVGLGLLGGISEAGYTACCV
jgi:Fe-S-cluster containining protein